jgi:hypothetical protein
MARPLDVTCFQCHREMNINADHWPDDLTVPSFGPKMACTKCVASAPMAWRRGGQDRSFSQQSFLNRDHYILALMAEKHIARAMKCYAFDDLRLIVIHQ